VPRRDGHAGICALAPPQRSAEGGRAYKVTTIAGESFWVVLPDGHAPSAGVVAVPDVPIRANALLTTARPAEAADRSCDGFPACEPTVVGRERHVVRWDDASGTIRDLGVSTVDFGAWTLVLSQLGPDRAERIGRAIDLSVDADGYPRVASNDPDVPVDADWAGVTLWVPEPGRRHRLIHVTPGCRLTAKEPGDLGGSDVGPELERNGPDVVEGGRWCVGGRYWVDVAFAGRPGLELLHEELRIVEG
jgi:hypothetical protein